MLGHGRDKACCEIGGKALAHGHGNGRPVSVRVGPTAGAAAEQALRRLAKVGRQVDNHGTKTALTIAVHKALANFRHRELYAFDIRDVIVFTLLAAQ